MNLEAQTYSVREVASILRIGKNQAYEAIRRNAIPHLRLGKRIVIPVVALQRLLAEAGAGGQAEGEAAGDGA